MTKEKVPTRGKESIEYPSGKTLFCDETVHSRQNV
jgi:hypothetical protein